jgi:hypothetical protein
VTDSRPAGTTPSTGLCISLVQTASGRGRTCKRQHPVAPRCRRGGHAATGRWRPEERVVVVPKRADGSHCVGSGQGRAEWLKRHLRYLNRRRVHATSHAIRGSVLLGMGATGDRLAYSDGSGRLIDMGGTHDESPISVPSAQHGTWSPDGRRSPSWRTMLGRQPGRQKGDWIAYYRPGARSA